MKLRSRVEKLTNELENDLARMMLIEKRHAGKIGSQQARELIAKVKGALSNDPSKDAGPAEQDFVEGFRIH
ncbi:MAG: hypothetical protein HOP17_14680 [Acidobacteria bacterium]|nr:hypothetical protein [Acidobacteriota bacterium]